MRFARKVRLAGFLALLTVALVVAAPPAWAATISVADLGVVSIGADVNRAVLGINMTGGNSFNGVSVVLEDAGGDGDFDLTTLSDLQASPDGVAVYRDNSKTGTNDDVLDAGDSRVSTGFTNAAGDVDVTVNSSVPAAAEGDYTFFLAIQTSNSIETGDDFIVTIPSPLLGCAFETSPDTLFCEGASTQTITADRSVPTAQMTSAPATVDGNVVWTFSEDVVASTVNEGSVVLREDGSIDNIPSAVTYNASNFTATINPDAPLTPGTTYDTIVNPTGTSNPVADAAGNQVAENTADFFSLAGVGFTPGVVRGNTWLLSNGPNRVVDIEFQFGKATDFPIAGDWDDDGEWNAGVVRGNVWYLANEMPPATVTSFAFGKATDYPVVGDWDGNGTYTPGLVRGNQWFLTNSIPPAAPLITFNFASATDFPVVGDWNGNGTTTPGVVRGNVWYLTNQIAPQTVTSYPFGKATDFPITGDWDDDGRWTVGVIRGNVWFQTNQSPPQTANSFAFGLATDFPVVGDWDGPSQTSSAGLLPKVVPGS